MRLWDAGSETGGGFIRFGRCYQTLAAAGEDPGCIPSLHRMRTKGPVRRSLPTISAMRKKEHMISPETRVQIRRYFYAEHWKIGTIARELNVHPDAIRNAIESDRFNRTQPMRPCITDPYMEFVRQTLDQHPRLRATRIHQMIRDRGYTGSVIQLRRAVARLRPPTREPFLKLQVFPAEQAQVDWAHFGQVAVGRARRTLSCFVATLSWSRALYLEFFFDQTMENFLRGHVHAFEDWSGQPRVILYDNLRSAVLERRGNEIHFNPRLMELCAHYHFVARPCQVRAGNQKGRVERAIRYVRESFWAGRSFTTLAECNRQALLWRDQVAHRRRWPGDDNRTVAEVFAEEQPRLLPKPAHFFPTDLVLPVRAAKTIYVRFDLNDYSIPPEAVGRQLTLVASDTLVRILEGTAEIARHHRTYDRHQLVLDPAHQQALLKTKRKAFDATPSGRLALAATESKTLLDLAFAQGESAGSQTAQLLKLLDLYGPAALRRAIHEALERNTPRASSVAFLLRKQQRSAPA
ncbi:MAG: IS21 family transposase, partial [Acidobacteriota bacterium]|nr:IS21 family transposase [Acidobacteriota bacterium]